MGFTRKSRGGKEDWRLKERVPCSQLSSDPTFTRLIKFYTLPYLGKYYYWTAYDILRRLMQTGGVVLVEILFRSEQVATCYALAVAIAFWGVHLYALPFKDAGDDKLDAVFQLH